MSPIKALLLFLFKLLELSKQSKIKGRTKLQKIIYLVSREDDVFDFHFVGYHFGPYSKELQKTLGKMAAFNMISEEKEKMNHDIYNYNLTNEGIEQATELWENIDKDSKDKIVNLAKKGAKLNSYSFNRILSKAYEIAEKEGIL